jgi:hypothetical protein
MVAMGKALQGGGVGVCVECVSVPGEGRGIMNDLASKALRH